mmetsp:Transcript_38619/g.75985  ORF Transcript_38619/g.75985 Transcript_38619/m.75985 type:complete len:1819 (+) Transcript_38619:53-5509(+)
MLLLSAVVFLCGSAAGSHPALVRPAPARKESFLEHRNIHKTRTAGCPFSSKQRGPAGAAIPGCGLDKCDSPNRFRHNKIELCYSACQLDIRCVAFSWAGVGVDKTYPDKPVCTRHGFPSPTTTLPESNQTFCALHDVGPVCAKDNGVCKCQGTVVYGGGGTYLPAQHVNGTVGCGEAQFRTMSSQVKFSPLVQRKCHCLGVAFPSYVFSSGVSEELSEEAQEARYSRLSEDCSSRLKEFDERIARQNRLIRNEDAKLRRRTTRYHDKEVDDLNKKIQKGAEKIAKAKAERLAAKKAYLWKISYLRLQEAALEKVLNVSMHPPKTAIGKATDKKIDDIFDKSLVQKSQNGVAPQEIELRPPGLSDVDRTVTAHIASHAGPLKQDEQAIFRATGHEHAAPIILHSPTGSTFVSLEARIKNLASIKARLQQLAHASSSRAFVWREALIRIGAALSDAINDGRLQAAVQEGREQKQWFTKWNHLSDEVDHMKIQQAQDIFDLCGRFEREVAFFHLRKVEHMANRDTLAVSRAHLEEGCNDMANELPHFTAINNELSISEREFYKVTEKMPELPPVELPELQKPVPSPATYTDCWHYGPIKQVRCISKKGCRFQPKVASAKICQVKCSQSPRCNFFSFNTRTNRCMLMQRMQYSTNKGKNSPMWFQQVSGPRTCHQWTKVATEAKGVGIGAKFDQDSMRTLDFKNILTVAPFVSAGNYFVKLVWGSDFIEFKVPSEKNVFSQSQPEDITVTNIMTSVLRPLISGSATFCHACVSSSKSRPGGTCWALTPRWDRNRKCGCSSGSWRGNGLYYGGFSNANKCHGHGGGWAGPRLNKQPKGKVASLGLTIYVRDGNRSAILEQRPTCWTAATSTWDAFSQFFTSDAFACQARCYKHVECHEFVYDKQHGKCWLKYHEGEESEKEYEHSQRFSGPKECPPPLDPPKPPVGAPKDVGYKCATEHAPKGGDVCYCEGVVSYGAKGKFFREPVSDWVTCSNTEFGDPIVGTVKECFCNHEMGTKCAEEHAPGKAGVCQCNGKVSYGAEGEWKSKEVLGSVECNNNNFGDPIRGVRKACFCRAAKQDVFKLEEENEFVDPEASCPSETVQVGPISIAKEDKRNRFAYVCTGGGWFPLYSANSLTPSQKEEVAAKFPGKTPQQYACLQGCKGACVPQKGGLAVLHKNTAKFSDSWGSCTGDVTLYQHGGFKGWHANFAVGDHDFPAFLRAGAKNDDASSIKVPEGCIAVVYEHSKFLGWHATFKAGAHDYRDFLKAGARNDHASSIKVENSRPKPTPRPKRQDFGSCQDSVTLFQHSGFKGWAAHFHVGSFDHSAFTKAGAKNDQASSIKVPKGCIAVVYEHGHFQGWKATFNAGTYDYREFLKAGARNDHVSAIRVLNAELPKKLNPKIELDLFSDRDPSTCGMDGCQDRFKIQNVAACRDWCLSDAKCKAFTWDFDPFDKNHSAVRACTRFASAKPDPAAASQLFCKLQEACPVGSIQVGEVGAGSNGCGLDRCRDRFRHRTARACMQSCARDKRCQAFVFNEEPVVQNKTGNPIIWKLWRRRTCSKHKEVLQAKAGSLESCKADGIRHGANYISWSVRGSCLLCKVDANGKLMEHTYHRDSGIYHLTRTSGNSTENQGKGEKMCTRFGGTVPEYHKSSASQTFCKVFLPRFHREVCPSGSVQEHGNGADIRGCGLDACSDRYDTKTVEECKKKCGKDKKCKAFSFVRGKDKSGAFISVCTRHTHDIPNVKGKHGVFCKIQGEVFEEELYQPEDPREKSLHPDSEEEEVEKLYHSGYSDPKHDVPADISDFAEDDVPGEMDTGEIDTEEY